MNDGYRVQVTREENVIALPVRTGVTEKKRSRAKSQGDVKDARVRDAQSPCVSTVVAIARAAAP